MLRTFTAGQPANHLAVATAIRRLRGHHSRSTLPVQARALLAQRRNTYTMTTSPRPQPWKCSVCKQNVRAQALFCGQCGGHWESVAVVPTPTVPTYHSWERTPAPWRSSGQEDGWQSPRRHNRSPRRWKEQGKGKPQKGADKGKGEAKGKAQTLLHQPRLQYQDQRLHRQAQRHHRRNVCSSRH